MNDYISELYTIPLKDHEKPLSSTFRELTGILRLLERHSLTLADMMPKISYITIICDNTAAITGLISKGSNNVESRGVILKIHDILNELGLFGMFPMG